MQPVYRVAVVGIFVFACAIEMSAWTDNGSESTTKPWTRWWWPGSAVDEAGLTSQMEQLVEAGIGGVEITPIYGARGYEDRYVEFLSPRYLELLEHVGREGRRLGLGVDMVTGTGWPFGGPTVVPADGVHRFLVDDGAIKGEPTGMRVKRAAPGGAGWVLDPYATEALTRYLDRFGEAFAGFPQNLIRSQFHDSFEYFDAGWTPSLADRFHEMHGYHLAEHASALADQAGADPASLARFKGDIRAVLGQLHLEFLQAWIEWCHGHGFLARNQSHGAPANLLDLYAAVDIAETETFGSSPFLIPGLRRDTVDIVPDGDRPEPLVMRFASSAAHVAGHRLASSETCTWLRDHWKVSLAMVKPEIDRLFVNGINHIVYHGTVYSPPDAPWPGWLFYASTQFNPQNTWWRDFAALNAYVTRVQSVLQAGQPDNDILLYWPVHDLWDDAEGLVLQFKVHGTEWATDTAFGGMAADLMAGGFGFDAISDRQIQSLTVDDGAMVTPGGRYPILVVPEARRMPLGTLRAIVDAAEQGVRIILGGLPEDVPGLGRLDERRAAFEILLERLQTAVDESKLPVRLASPADAAGLSNQLAEWGGRQEGAAAQGLDLIRRRTPRGHTWFVSNLSGRPFEGWLPLAVEAETIVLTNPLDGYTARGSLRPSGRVSEVFLQLAPGASLLMATEKGKGEGAATWPYLKASGERLEVEGPWRLKATRGGPEEPPTSTLVDLASWTNLPDPAWSSFGGTACYETFFNLEANPADDWMLDLGDVRESARVRLNGQDVGTLWSLPMRLRVGSFLRAGENRLEIEVTNLAANRIRALDRAGVDWKIMHEINFVDIHYKPFDASGWSLQPSGLLGPVTLTPMGLFER